MEIINKHANTHSKPIHSRDDGLPAVADVLPLAQEAALVVGAVRVVLHLLDVSTGGERLLAAWWEIYVPLEVEGYIFCRH